MTTDLHTLRPLVEIIAAERTASQARPELFEDAVQEGLIAAWQTLEARPDAPTAYVTGAARNGVRAVLRGRPMTGAPTHRGRPYVDALDFTAEILSADEGDDTTGSRAGHLEDVSAADALERAELIPHLPLVRAAVAALEPRDVELVVLRFVHGLDWPAVGARLRKGGEAARRRFTNHIAPRLRTELAHLEGAA